MTRLKNSILGLALCLLSIHQALGQEQDTLRLGFSEYLLEVLRYHPLARQAELRQELADAGVLLARGRFDPVIEGKYDVKEFEGKQYWDRRKALFRVPTGFGLELRAGFSTNEGQFLDPSETLPEDGLYAAGVALKPFQLVWLDERRAALKQAKLYREVGEAERQLLLSDLFYQASVAYFDWELAYLDFRVYERYLNAAQSRLDGVRRRALAGDLALVDTLEARASFDARRIQRESALLKLRQSRLELGVFLWTEDGMPLEPGPGVLPELPTSRSRENLYGLILQDLDSLRLENHPKLRALESKARALGVERRFKRGMLLPQLELEYNFINEDPGPDDGFNASDYKAGATLKFPLFLRKERGALRMASVKMEDAQLEARQMRLVIANKIQAGRLKVQTLQNQLQLTEEVLAQYEALLAAERRKFSLGESSVFLLVNRENAAVTAALERNELRNQFNEARAALLQTYGVVP